MNRIYLRLFLGFCAANLVTLLVTAIVTERIARYAYTNIEPDWVELAKSAAAVYDSAGPSALGTWGRGMRVRGIETVAYSGARILGDSPPKEIEPYLAELARAPQVTLHPNPDETLSSVVVERSGREPFRLVTFRGSGRRSQRLWLLLANQLAASVVVVAIVGWYLTRSISIPAAAVQATARSLAEGNLASRVGLPTTRRNDTFGQLARDFDGMAERIQLSVEQTRGLLQDVSHELRSPLARLQLALELAGGATATELPSRIKRAQDIVGNLNSIIEETLALARLEAGIPDAAFEAVRLDELLTRCIESVQQDASRSIRLDAEPIEARIDRALLERAIRNLLHNAIKFSPASEEIVVDLKRRGPEAEIKVLDRGPGVPDRELDSIFQPFFRGENAQLAAGTGLGLAIARRIALAYKGRITAENREGGGLAVSFRLRLEP